MPDKNFYAVVDMRTLPPLINLTSKSEEGATTALERYQAHFPDAEGWSYRLATITVHDV